MMMGSSVINAMMVSILEVCDFLLGTWSGVRVVSAHNTIGLLGVMEIDLKLELGVGVVRIYLYSRLAGG